MRTITRAAALKAMVAAAMESGQLTRREAQRRSAGLLSEWDVQSDTGDIILPEGMTMPGDKESNQDDNRKD